MCVLSYEIGRQNRHSPYPMRKLSSIFDMQLEESPALQLDSVDSLKWLLVAGTEAENLVVSFVNQKKHPS